MNNNSEKLTTGIIVTSTVIGVLILFALIGLYGSWAAAFVGVKLWDEILRKFSRKSNNYCQPILTVNRRRASKYLAFQALSNACSDKYRCVTLCNFGNGLSKSSRVEVRGFGNKDYTHKYDTIEGFVKRIERLFRLSCANVPLTRTISV